MGNVLQVDFMRRKGFPKDAYVNAVPNIDRSRILVRVVVPENRSRDVEVGEYSSHVDACGDALAAAADHGLQFIDQVAVSVDGIWNLRPVASMILIYPALACGYQVAIRPPADIWSALAGWYPTIDVAGVRAAELAEVYRLPIVGPKFSGGGEAA